MRIETPLYDVAPASVEPMSGVRGTVLIAGRKIVQARGLFGAYEALVPAPARAALAAVTAGEVAPMPLVHLHESALDRLDLPRGEARSLGVEMSRSVNGLVFSTIARLAGRLGASPWLVLAKAPKVWARLYQGGATAVFRRDERTARVAVLGDPLARYGLHREAFGGGLLHVAEAYSAQPLIAELVEYRTSTEFSFQIRW